MFSFFKKKKHNLIESGILLGATDVHCHILPHVDDGSPDYVTSIKLLQFLKQLGYQEVWFTPHSMEDLPLNTAAYIQKNLQEFQEKYTGSMQLHAASEYMMDGKFLPMLREDQVLPLGSKNHLLVETSYYCGPENLQDILKEIVLKGYTPVIAHPERYMYMEWPDLLALKDQNYKFQMNLNSLSGYYGKREKAICEQLLNNGLYNYVGTDIHHLGNYCNYLESIETDAATLDQVAYLLSQNKTL